VQFDRKCAVVVLVYAALTAVTIYSNAMLRPRPRCGGEMEMEGKERARGERKGEEKEVKGKRMGGKEKGTKPREKEEKGKEKRGRGREREEFCAVVIFLFRSVKIAQVTDPASQLRPRIRCVVCQLIQ